MYIQHYLNVSEWPEIIENRREKRKVSEFFKVGKLYNPRDIVPLIKRISRRIRH